jgi:hypothetical protein
MLSRKGGIMISPFDWRLINRVRDASYNFFTYDEKQRMHDLVVTIKRTDKLSIKDRKWLEEMDANFAGIPSLTGTFRRRKGGVR